jgi:flagellar biosynthesis protein FlhB
VSGARTEEPTPRRLREARRRGEVARSADLGAAAALAGGLAALAVVGPDLLRDVARELRSRLALAAGGAADPAAAVAAAGALLLRLALPVGGAAAAAAAAAGAWQAGFAVVPAALRPRPGRLDPGAGLRRLCAPASAARAGLGVLKAATLAGVCAAWWSGAAASVGELPRASGSAALAAAGPLLTPLALRLALAVAALGAADLVVERARWRKALRMTRDEVRRERREDEGDPAPRAERRRRHRALLEAAPLARATVVVVNPTHVAVALRHDRAGGGAPRVLAKGAGAAAARIRSAARRAGVPVVRDPPLARALHRLAEIGDEIPEELYEAAAVVLAELYRDQERAP